MSQFNFPRAGRSWMLVFTSAATLLVGACSSPAYKQSRACDGNNFGRVNLEPGCSAVCTDEPCAVHFQMPPGEGEYLVRTPGVRIGEYPAGEKVFLGAFWVGTYVFTVEGTEAPPAYLNVVTTSIGH